MDGNITLIHRIAALHIVYEMNRSQVLWFGQLVAYSPEIMIHLNRNNICDKKEMVLPCYNYYYYALAITFRSFIFEQLNRL